jgi:hypothetical protein
MPKALDDCFWHSVQVARIQRQRRADDAVAELSALTAAIIGLLHAPFQSLARNEFREIKALENAVIRGLDPRLSG